MHLRGLVIGLTSLLALLILGGGGQAYNQQCHQKCNGEPLPSCQNIEYCISACNVAPNLRQACAIYKEQSRAGREYGQRLKAKESEQRAQQQHVQTCKQRCDMVEFQGRQMPTSLNRVCRDLDFCISTCGVEPQFRQTCKAHGR